MTIETQVSPDADTQIPAPELTTEAPEIVTPETQVEDEQQSTSETPEDEATKALKRMQRRIDKRTADVYRERAEKDQLAQRVAELEARLRPAEEPQGKEPIPEEAIKPIAERMAQDLVRQHEVTRSIQGVLKEGKALDGFDAACNTLNEELPFYDRANRPTPFLLTVLESEAPAKLLHHLGKNPDLAAELADLTPTQVARRLDRIERDLSEQAKPKTSGAPKPLEPVKGQGGDAKDPSAMTDAEFAAWRRRQIAQRR